ncbi:MAG: DUF1178 family protein [Beijerinckiaceae bacterium]
MIKYALQCNKGHGFESWFDSGAAYDKLAKRGFVECPVCGSTQIEKQIMSPSVRLAAAQPPKDATAETGPASAGAAAPAQAATPAAISPEPSVPAIIEDRPLAMHLEKAEELREMIRSFHAHVEANTDDVGSKFADEARKIHYGETEERAIRGRATRDEAEELHEEGIGFLPLPPLPDKHN